MINTRIIGRSSGNCSKQLSTRLLGCVGGCIGIEIELGLLIRGPLSIEIGGLANSTISSHISPILSLYYDSLPRRLIDNLGMLTRRNHLRVLWLHRRRSLMKIPSGILVRIVLAGRIRMHRVR